jgi:putative adenylate-forming enzyme
MAKLPWVCPDFLLLLVQFIRTRWGLNFRSRAQLEAWQQHQLRRFFCKVLPRAPRFRAWRTRPPQQLADLPLMDKAVMMSDFAAFNTQGITLDQALPVTLAAESSRDFSPMLGQLTVGLSSGTSGNRGVFLVSREERFRWAGILLARTLPSKWLVRLLLPWLPPLRIAFFLRANSNLYTTLNRRRIDFGFHDLLEGVDAAIPLLQEQQPDVLVAPPSLLRQLAAAKQAGKLDLPTGKPELVISVAEVLENDDRQAIEAAFGCTPRQLYQATEGFLAYSCEQGKLHLNESFVHIEPAWLDDQQIRFQPIVTDFTRETQLIVRYKLNDILRLAAQPCACGRAEHTLEAIEGRADEVFWLPRQEDGKLCAVYPDFIRRAMLLVGEEIKEFTVTQTGMQLGIALQADAKVRNTVIERIQTELNQLWQQLGLQPPSLVFGDWQAPAAGDKRRRVRCLQPPTETLAEVQ